MADIWLDGIMGVVTGDALGCPVQFAERDEIKECPVTGMEGYGTYNMPEGTWTDDSSMTLALLASIRESGAIDPEDIMVRFVGWLVKGEYTPFGESFDIGGGTMAAINRYILGCTISAQRRSWMEKGSLSGGCRTALIRGLSSMRAISPF